MHTETIQIRASLLDAIQVDLIGSSKGHVDHLEVLPQAPSRWYLNGYPASTDADEEQRYDPNSVDNMDQAAAAGTVGKFHTPGQRVNKRSRRHRILTQKKTSLASTTSDRHFFEEINAIDNHPRFIMHDSPREDELEMSLLKRIFDVTCDLESCFGSSMPSFPTTKAARSYCSESHLHTRLVLRARGEEGRLLKMRL